MILTCIMKITSKLASCSGIFNSNSASNFVSNSYSYYKVVKLQNYRYVSKCELWRSRIYVLLALPQHKRGFFHSPPASFYALWTKRNGLLQVSLGLPLFVWVSEKECNLYLNTNCSTWCSFYTCRVSKSSFSNQDNWSIAMEGIFKHLAKLLWNLPSLGKGTSNCCEGEAKILVAGGYK